MVVGVDDFHLEEIARLGVEKAVDIDHPVNFRRVGVTAGNGSAPAGFVNQHGQFLTNAGFQFGELIGSGGTPELPIVAKNCTCAAYRSSVIDAITKWQPLSDADHARFMKKYTPVNLPNGINDIAARYEGGRTGWFIRLKLTGNNPDAFNKTVVPYKQVELKTAIESLGAP